MPFKSTITNSVHRQLEAEKYLANTILRELVEIHNILKPFEGEKVVKVDGYWTKKFDDAIEPIRANRFKQTFNTPEYRISTNVFNVAREYKSIYIQHKAWVCWEQFNDNRSDHGAYYEIKAYVAKVTNDNLLELTDMERAIEGLRTMVNRDWLVIETKLEAREELLSEIRALETDLPYYSYR